MANMDLRTSPFDLSGHVTPVTCFVNAGVGGQAPSFVEMTTEEWRRVMRVDLEQRQCVSHR